MLSVDLVTGTVDDTFNVAIKALDEFDNVNASNVSVVVETEGSVSGPRTPDEIQLVNGVGELVVDTTVPEVITLVLSPINPGIDEDSTRVEITVGVGAAHTVAIVDPGQGLVGTPLSVSFELLDQYGNLVSDADEKHIQLKLASADPDDLATLSGGGKVIVSAGEGSKDIFTQLSQDVTLSLIDFFDTGLRMGPPVTVFFQHGE